VEFTVTKNRVFVLQNKLVYQLKMGLHGVFKNYFAMEVKVEFFHKKSSQEQSNISLYEYLYLKIRSTPYKPLDPYLH
jgi:hypothetical protein